MVSHQIGREVQRIPELAGSGIAGDQRVHDGEPDRVAKRCVDLRALGNVKSVSIH